MLGTDLFTYQPRPSLGVPAAIPAVPSYGAFSRAVIPSNCRAGWRTPGTGARALIKKHMPTFCWQTAHEVLTFLEQIDEDIDPVCVQGELCRFRKCGFLIARNFIPCICLGSGYGRTLEYRRAE